MKTKKVVNFRYGELFCGPGGLALGAFSATAENNDRQYKIVHGWSSDYDPDSCATYLKNITHGEKSSVICSDVRNLDIKTLDPIDAFAYGFPCNDFSLVGEQKGFRGEFGSLYTYGVKVINAFKPKFFVAENVSGLTSANDGGAFKKIADDLANRAVVVTT